MPKRMNSDVSSASNREENNTKKQRHDSTDSSSEEINLFSEPPEPENQSDPIVISVDVHRTSDGDIVNTTNSEAPNEENFEFLGTKPNQNSEMEESLHEQLVLRWSSYIQDGIEKEQKEKIMSKYPLFENCPLLKSPKLGPELESCLDAKSLRQDKFMTHLQKETGHALAALGSQINKLLASNTSTTRETVTVMADAAQLICNVQHALSTHRKYNILPFLNNSCRKLVENSKSDDFLLGKNFLEDLKTSETAKKTGLTLKATTSYNTKPYVFKQRPQFAGNNVQTYRNSTHSVSGPSNLNFKRQPSNTRKKTRNPQSTQFRRNGYKRPQQYRQQN